MKCVLEFGIRGGYHIDNIILPTIKLGMKLASALANSFAGRDQFRETYWAISRHEPRITWQTNTHFIALSLLDDVIRGPASNTLWKMQ